jgi:formate-dependent nitrite reductase membrane component NrfD
MLPSERNERLVWRVGVTLIVLMILVVLVWMVRFINRRAHRLLQQRNIPVDEGRVPVTGMG